MLTDDNPVDATNVVLNAVLEVPGWMATLAGIVILAGLPFVRLTLSDAPPARAC